MTNNYFDSDLVFPKIKAKDYTDAITQIVNKLREKSIVKQVYLEKILEREKNYPTGLECGEVNVAVPHSDHMYVNEGRVVFATLDKPVQFHKMDDPEVEIPVSIIIMLVVNEPKAHIDLLQKVFTIVQDQNTLKELVEAADKQELIKLTNKIL